MAAGLAGKIVFTGDKLRKACDIEGVGNKNCITEKDLGFRLVELTAWRDASKKWKK